MGKKPRTRRESWGTVHLTCCAPKWQHSCIPSCLFGNVNGGVGSSDLESEARIPSTDPYKIHGSSFIHVPHPGGPPASTWSWVLKSVPCSIGTGGANAELGHNSNKFTLLLQILEWSSRNRDFWNFPVCSRTTVQATLWDVVRWDDSRVGVSQVSERMRWRQWLLKYRREERRGGRWDIRARIAGVWGKICFHKEHCAASVAQSLSKTLWGFSFPDLSSNFSSVATV